MTIPLDRPAAAQAGAELLVLQKWEETAAWLLNHTARWPKAARFTLTQRIENHALDVLELLVQARYEPGLRRRRARRKIHHREHRGHRAATEPETEAAEWFRGRSDAGRP